VRRRRPARAPARGVLPRLQQFRHPRRHPHGAFRPHRRRPEGLPLRHGARRRRRLPPRLPGRRRPHRGGHRRPQRLTRPLRRRPHGELRPHPRPRDPTGAARRPQSRPHRRRLRPLGTCRARRPPNRRRLPGMSRAHLPGTHRRPKSPQPHPHPHGPRRRPGRWRPPRWRLRRRLVGVLPPRPHGRLRLRKRRQNRRCLDRPMLSSPRVHKAGALHRLRLRRNQHRARPNLQWPRR
jgi:hypothetical protein